MFRWSLCVQTRSEAAASVWALSSPPCNILRPVSACAYPNGVSSTHRFSPVFVKNITFGQFRFDLTNECLWQGTRAISLRPKAFGVLKVLLEHPGELVNKQQVLDAVWPGTFVGDAVLKDSIRQLRDALDDNAGSPSYIETAHRRGYRFIAKLSQPSPSDENLIAAPAQGAGSLAPDNTVLALRQGAVQMLGRDAELAKMRTWMDLALKGERQTVFITGEAGIGKTTLVQAFLEQAE